MTKLFKNRISLKWFLLLIGVVIGIGYAVASTNPIISNVTSYLDTLIVTNSITANSYTATGTGINYFNSNIHVNNTNQIEGDVGGLIYYIGSFTNPNIGAYGFSKAGATQLAVNISTGNVDVGGVTNPTYKLQVEGTMAVIGVTTNTGESACFNAATKEVVRNAGVSNTCAPSAEKYKNIKGYFNDSTVPNNFSRLSPIVFSYKDDTKRLEKFGFNANEIAISYPQVATTHYQGNGTFVKLILNQSNPNKADSIQYSDGVIADIEGINYEMFSAILVNQVQDQQFQLDTQSSQIRKICTNNPALCS